MLVVPTPSIAAEGWSGRDCGYPIDPEWFAEILGWGLATFRGGMPSNCCSWDMIGTEPRGAYSFRSRPRLRPASFAIPAGRVVQPPNLWAHLPDRVRPDGSRCFTNNPSKPTHHKPVDGSCSGQTWAQQSGRSEV